MEKLDGRTMDLVQQNIDELKRLFPEAITEGKIDFDRLRLLLGDEVETGKEKYEFTWPGKSDCIRLAQQQSTGTLRPDKESSKNWDTTQNLYIEGDNLEVLRLLQKTYHRKIKMIYIDPPYNTGNDFVYKDDYTDNVKNYREKTEQDMMAKPANSGRYHRDWLNLMYPRLSLARNLLLDDGVIFISIDDNEIHNLREVCDDVFGQENFVTQITLLCNPKGRSQDKYFATNHEYILVYSKTILPKGYFSIKKDDEQINSEYQEDDENGKYRLIELRNTHRDFGKHNRPNLFYKIFVDPCTSTITLQPESNFISIEPIWDDGFEGCWTWERNKVEKEIEYLEAKQIQNGKWKIYRKSYANGAEKMLKTIFNDKEFYTEKGQATFSLLFESKEKIFPSPKSVKMIMHLIQTITSNDDIILDFFSGSATTAHSIMQLNADDSEKRKYIMIQLPETCDDNSDAFKAGFSNICEIGKERIRRAGEKIKEENQDNENIDKLDIGFRAFKLDTSNLKAWDPEIKDLENTLKGMVDPIKEDRTQEDMLFEIMLKYGIDLTVPIDEIHFKGKTAYSIGLGYMIVCLEDGLTLDVIEAIGALKQRGQEIARVVFRDSGFADDNVKTNTVQLLKKFGIEDFRTI